MTDSNFPTWTRPDIPVTGGLLGVPSLDAHGTLRAAFNAVVMAQVGKMRERCADHFPFFLHENMDFPCPSVNSDLYLGI